MRYLDVSGSFPVAQSGADFLTLNLHQVGPDVTGSATWSKRGEDNGPLLVSDADTKVVSMELRGTVTDREFSFTIAWNDGTRGVYRGVVDSDGTMTGTTHDSMHPNGPTQTWAVLSRKFRLAPEPAPARKPAIKAIGRPRRKPKASPADALGQLTDLSIKAHRPPSLPK